VRRTIGKEGERRVADDIASDPTEKSIAKGGGSTPVVPEGPVIPVGGYPESPKQLTEDVGNLKVSVNTLQEQVESLQQQVESLQQQVQGISTQLSSVGSHTHTYGLPPTGTNATINLATVAQYIQGASGYGEYANALIHAWVPEPGLPNPPDKGFTGSTSTPVTN
jgi:hypothetical protein